MGNECNEEDRELRYNIFHEAIYIIENDIEKELYNPDISKKKYLPFGLVNKGLVRKYKFLLSQPLDKIQARKTRFNYNDLAKKIDKKDFSYLNMGTFSFPSDFMFVNEDFLDVINDYIPDYYRAKIKTIFNTIIGGDCLIMKDAKDHNNTKPLRYIILYYEIKDNLGNEIDFILKINDKNEIEEAENYILTNNLWKYFEKINYNFKEEYKKLYNKYKKEIGYIVRCSDISRIEQYYAKTMAKKQNLFQNVQNIPKFSGVNIPNVQNNFNINNPNFPNNINNQGIPRIQNKLNKISNPLTSMVQPSTIKLNPELALEPIILLFFKIDELKNALGLNKNIDIPSFKKIILTNIEKNIQKANNYQQIFDMILTNIDPNTKENKEYYNQTEQYDREKGFKNFMEKHNKGNLIQKLFLIPIEDVIYCHKCRMNIYKFNYIKYILIKNPLQELLYQKVFHPIKIPSKKGKICNFCNGEETEYSIERKIINYPEILIVIIEPYQINNFQLGLNAYITNGNNLTYSLIKFIEFNTNVLYWVDAKSNNKICYKFEKNRHVDPENLDNKKPIVLFYNLIVSNVNMNNPHNNMQMPLNQINPNITNQNNAINANNLTNGQQNFVPQNGNINNNAFNMNQVNILMNANSQGKAQIMPQQNMINQQNMNQQMNTAQNMNAITNPHPVNQPNINGQGLNIPNNSPKLNVQNNMNNNNIFQFNNFNNNPQNMMFNNNQNMMNNPIQNNINMNNMNNNMMNNNNNNQFCMNNSNQNNVNNNIINNNMMNNMGNNNIMNNMGNNNMMNNMGNNNMMNNMSNNNMMNNMNNNNMMNNMSNNNMMNNMSNNNMMNNMSNNIMNNMSNNMNNLNNNTGNMIINMNNMNFNNQGNNSFNINNQMNMLINNNGLNNGMNQNMINVNNNLMNMNNFNNNFNNNNMNINNMNMNNMNMGSSPNNMNFTPLQLQNLDQTQTFNSAQKSDNLIFVTFTFKKNKMQVYLDVEKNATFNQAIKQLGDKYSWFNNVKIKGYLYKNKTISVNDYNKTLKQLKIEDNADISILAD